MSRSFIILRNDEITSVAIGGFDGMHIAHQKLFENLDEKKALIVIETPYANLTPKGSRKEYFDGLLDFYELENIKHLSGKEFVEILKSKYPKLSKIVVGYDFGFGANKSNDANDLKKIFDANVLIVDEIFQDGISVHSRVIRNFIKNGFIKNANAFLGREYKISGKRVVGQGLGSSKFLPTINIEVKDYLLPNEGVYATQTKFDSVWMDSVTFVGHRVSTDNKFSIETHILDAKIDTLQNEIVKIRFFDKIRENQKYDDFEELKNQILDDVQQAKKFFEMR